MTEQHDYRKGRKFRVIKNGARLTGLKPSGPWAQIGWGRILREGDVLTCAGESMTFGDGVPVIKWLDENGQWMANDCEFSPSIGSLWFSRPDPSYLEPID